MGSDSAAERAGAPLTAEAALAAYRLRRQAICLGSVVFGQKGLGRERYERGLHKLHGNSSRTDSQGSYDG